MSYQIQLTDEQKRKAKNVVKRLAPYAAVAVASAILTRKLTPVKEKELFVQLWKENYPVSLVRKTVDEITVYMADGLSYSATLPEPLDAPATELPSLSDVTS